MFVEWGQITKTASRNLRVKTDVSVLWNRREEDAKKKAPEAPKTMAWAATRHELTAKTSWITEQAYQGPEESGAPEARDSVGLLVSLYVMRPEAGL